MQQYEDLYSLIRNDKEAEKYYSGLPDYVKETIAQRARNVNSLDSLKDYAENLTRDDE